MHGLLVKKQCVIVGLKLLSWWIIGSLLLVIFLTVLNLKSTWFRIKIVAVQKHLSSLLNNSKIASTIFNCI